MNQFLENPALLVWTFVPVFLISLIFFYTRAEIKERKEIMEIGKKLGLGFKLKENILDKIFRILTFGLFQNGIAELDGIYNDNRIIITYFSTTQIQVVFKKRLGFSLLIYPEDTVRDILLIFSPLAAIGRILNREIRIGDKAFDEAYRIEGQDASGIQHLLGRAEIRKAIDNAFHVEKNASIGMNDFGFIFRQKRVIKDIRRYHQILTILTSSAKTIVSFT